MSEQTSRFGRGLLASGAVMAGIWGLHELRKYFYDNRGNADELHHVTTDDGVEIALNRYRPEEPGEPVLAVHGFGVNHRHLDLNENLSLPCYLRDNGYDCWAIELRGRGDSEVPNESWNYDDYVNHDLPSAIDYILQRTGYPQLHWGGHSMGAMLYYSLAGTKPDYQDKIASAVAGQGPFHGRSSRQREASEPAQSTGFEDVFLPTLETLRRLRIPITGAARVGGFWYPQLRRILPDPLIHFFLNPEHTSPETLKQSTVRMVERVSPNVLGQFFDWAVNRHWIDSSGNVDYRQHIEDIEVPTRVIAGAIDKLCPPHNQKAGYEELGSSSKDYVLASTEEGFSVDYSHLDFIQGDNAPDEIYPLFDDWFSKHEIDG